MAYSEIEVQERVAQGSTAVSKLRREGSIPGVVYAGGEDAKQIMFDAHDFVVLARKSAPTQLFKFKSENSSLDGLITLVKAVQKESLKDSVLHVDFLQVHEGQRITLAVPIELLGEPTAVKEGRAVLNQTLHELDLECLPASIPVSIPVEIGHLDEGDSIHASDIEFPEGVELKSNPGLTIVSAVGSRAAVEEEEAAAAEAAEAGAEESGEGAAKEESEEKSDDKAEGSS